MKDYYKVLVCGSRLWRDSDLVYRHLDRLGQQHGPLIVIHGGATGADTAAACWGRDRAARVLCYEADWSRYGPRAGPIRNSEMLEERPDQVLAFTKDLGRSRGTADTVRKARRLGILVQVIGEEDS